MLESEREIFCSNEHFSFSSGRRYVVQRHFEQQLLDIQSVLVEKKWRHCLLEVIAKSSSPLYITRPEVELMHEIFSWHLNHAHGSIKLREKMDYLIDFEELIDCSKSISYEELTTSSNSKASFIQPVTTLDAARKNIEKWKNLQEHFVDKNTDPIVDDRVKGKSSKPPSKIHR